MACNCEGKNYNISMGCCEPVLAPIENYYTKYQVDKMIEGASGCCITPEEVESAITSAITYVEGEIPSLSGYATEQWVLDKHYISGVDLSDYALKSEIPTVPTSNTAFTNDAGYLTEHQHLKTINGESLIGDGNIVISGDTDLSNYYTKTETNNQISSATADMATKTWVGQQGYLTEHQSLSGYATEQWVLDKHYITGVNLSDYVTYEDMAEYVGDVYTKQEVNNLFVTKATFNTYITNLQQQIDSLKETISACCSSTGETEYRWIVKPNDYTCSGTTKMTKEIQQSSTDGINWTDTGQYRTGSTVLEYDSTDCGFVPSSNFKVRANYKRGYTVGSGQVECNSSTTLSQEEVKSITIPSLSFRGTK